MLPKTVSLMGRPSRLQAMLRRMPGHEIVAAVSLVTMITGSVPTLPRPSTWAGCSGTASDGRSDYTLCSLASLRAPSALLGCPAASDGCSEYTLDAAREIYDGVRV